MPATYEPIATTTLSSAASSITFSSIPSTYTDLRLVFVGTGAGTDPTLRGRFNNNTSALYSYTGLRGTGAAASSGRGISSDYFFVESTFMSLSQPEMVTLDIFSYAGSTNKTFLTTRQADTNGSGDVEMSVGLFRSTSAISSIQLLANLFSGSGQFATGTTATLYGIKAA